MAVPVYGMIAEIETVPDCQRARRMAKTQLNPSSLG